MWSVTRGEVQSLVMSWSQEHAPGTVRNYYDVLARMFIAAVDDRVGPDSPCKKITLPPMPNKEVIPPQLMRPPASPRRCQMGIRRPPSFWLGPASVSRRCWDCEPRTSRSPSGQVRVERQRLQSGLIGPPKSGRSRNVPVGQVVLDALQAHLEDHP